MSNQPRSAFRNYTLQRERDFRECPWVRPTELKYIISELPRPLVIVNGCFDLLHSSHMRLIFAARHKAATLVCLLDTDAKVRKLKGASRPILSFTERATHLNYMPIDLIVPIENGRDMGTAIRALRPTLHVQGEAYRGTPNQYSIPKLFIREGKVHTSEIEKRILQNR